MAIRSPARNTSAVLVSTCVEALSSLSIESYRVQFQSIAFPVVCRGRLVARGNVLGRRSLTCVLCVIGGEEAVDPALHPVAGSRVPVPRRQLPFGVVPEDEARRDAHALVQAQDQRRLPHLQAAHRPVLLPRQALQRDQVPGAVLPQHPAEAAPAADPAADADGAAWPPCRRWAAATRRRPVRPDRWARADWAGPRRRSRAPNRPTADTCRPPPDTISPASA